MVRRLLVLCAGVVAVLAIAGPAVASSPQPVRSLTPAATQRLWTELVQRPRVHAFRTADCRPLRAVFYAATDWLRLTTKLAATASPCAQYYISVPPLAADKSQLRPNEANRIRALGPAFHALAEINVTGWTAWVAATGSSWYQAGVEARRRMAATGYDVAAGDTWALNELSSAVRQGTGNARANMRAFLNGLYDGDGVLPTARGTVFVAGIGQGTTDLSLYQARLQDWYEDAAFWSDLSRFASDWSQEVYGDVRNYAVAGAARETRRDRLNEYLQHQTALAGVAPPSADAARSFLAAFSSPLANAAWRYDAAFGWTDVPVELMEDYASAQTYAMRSAATGRFGYAWAPKNLAAIPTADFNAQTDALLVRLAAAIADSGDSPDAACGASWCSGSLAGAAATAAWSTFGAWKPSRLAFTSPEQTVAPGAVSTPLTVELQTNAGTAYTAGVPVERRTFVVVTDGRALGESRRTLGDHALDPHCLRLDGGERLLPGCRRRLGDGHRGRCGEDGCDAGDRRRRPTPGFARSVGRRRSRSRSRRPGERDAHRTDRRRRDHVHGHGPEPRWPGCACAPRRPAPDAVRVHRQSERPWPGLLRHVSSQLRPRLPRRRSRCDGADQRRRPRTGDARLRGCLLGTAGRPAAGERHGPPIHGRRASGSGGEPDDHPPHAPRGRRADTADAGARRRDRFRPLLARRLRPARGAPDDNDLDAADHTARRKLARGHPIDEGTTDSRGARLARRRVPLQGAGRRGQADPRTYVPRPADGDRCRRQAANIDDQGQGLMRGERLFVVDRPAGAEWVSGKGAREQPLWDEHAAFMDDLFERGLIALGGPFLDDSGAMLVMRVADESEARELLEPDPWCSNGRDIQGIGRIRPWTIFLDSHGGV